MSNNLLRIRNLGILLFVGGLLVSLVYQAGAIWADFEASMFDATLPTSWADTDLTTLHCPLVINSNETGVIKASFTNHTSKDVDLRIRVHVADGLVTLLREENTILPITPGETAHGEWEVFPKDTVWGHFILVRVFQFRAYQIPSRSTSCGVLLIDLFNLSGNQIVFLAISLSGLGMLIGLGLLFRAYRPLKGRTLSAIIALALLVILWIIGIATSLWGTWLLGGGVLIVTGLLMAALLPFLSQTY
jgi:hypothetical protein